MPGHKPTGSKKPKPSFDVAREAIPETKSGWVYRSDAQPAPEPIIDIGRKEPTWSPPVPGQRARAYPRDSSRTAPPEESRSWFATGMYLMMLPMTLGISMMFAPVSWILGKGSHQGPLPPGSSRR